MKNLRQLCVAVVLTLVLTTSAFAGDIEFPVAPPATSSATTATATTGQIETGVASTSTTTASNQSAGAPSITETVMSLLQGVLSLF